MRFKVLFDYLPIVLFFIAYLLFGFYVATWVIIITSAVQLATFWFVHKKVDKMHLIMFVLVAVLGTTTLILHDEIYLKWKPTVIYWLFAVVLIGSFWIGRQTIIQRMLGDKFEMAQTHWRKLNLAWALFFTALGFINVYVLYNFSTKAWVYFKLFGTLGLILVFAIIQAFYITRHATEIKHDKSQDKKPDQQPKSH